MTPGASIRRIEPALAGGRAVKFLCLTCAARYGAQSPIADAYLTDGRWAVRPVRPFSRNEQADFDKLRSLVRVPVEPCALYLGALSAGGSREVLHLSCRRCGTPVATTPKHLVSAALGHPGQREPGGDLVAWIASRGEVRHALDDGSRRLAARDRSAAQIRPRQGQSPGTGLRADPRWDSTLRMLQPLLEEIWSGVPEPRRPTVVAVSRARVSHPAKSTMYAILGVHIVPWCDEDEAELVAPLDGSLLSDVV